MNANQIAFGIEFETTLPGSDTTPIGPYHRGFQVPWLPRGWRAERDASIRATGTRKGCELVSPKLMGAAGLSEVTAAIEAMRARGAAVNESCGLHITVTWNGSASALARLISLVGNHEGAIFASTGTRRRERTIYTKGIKKYRGANDAKSKCEADRYHLLNLTHLARGQNRIEFRAFSGSLNATKVAGYLMMVLGRVERALATDRCASWTYNKRPGKSSWDREGAGHGESELVRLFYRLGWIKGKQASAIKGRTMGELTNGDIKPDWKAIKAKLMEMAAKYDQEPAFA